MYIFSDKNLNYILKPTVEDLQLLFGEVSLSLQLFEALGPVTHRGHLQLIICFICQEDEARTSKTGLCYYGDGSTATD